MTLNCGEHIDTVHTYAHTHIATMYVRPGNIEVYHQSLFRKACMWAGGHFSLFITSKKIIKNYSKFVRVSKIGVEWP